MSNTQEYTQVWLAYVDLTDGGDRESWSVFYVEPFVGVTEASVNAAAKAEITKLATQECSENGDPPSDIPYYEKDYSIHIVGPLGLCPLVP